MKIQIITTTNAFLCCLTAMPLFAATSISYTYDAIGQLESATRSDGPSISYAYDAVSNLTSQTSNRPADSDGDRLPDSVELIYGLSISLSDSDGDGVSDYDEVCFDGNCSAYDPYDLNANPTGTDLNANILDTDGDGVNDATEVLAGTDPLDPASFPVRPDGDISGDGVVDVVDVLLAQQIVNGVITPTPEQMARGDVAPLIDGIPAPDGQFNAGDLIVIQRAALGLINL